MNIAIVLLVGNFPAQGVVGIWFLFLRNLFLVQYVLLRGEKLIKKVNTISYTKGDDHG